MMRSRTAINYKLNNTEESGDKQVILQRWSVNQSNSILHQQEQSHDLTFNTANKSRFDKDFGQVPAHGDIAPSSGRDSAEGWTLPRLTITASPKDSSPTAPAGTGSPAASHPRPFTAEGRHAMHEVESCHIPPGHYGVSKAIQYRIRDFHGATVHSPLTIKERFTRLEGPEAVFRKLKPVTYHSVDGRFDDCYMLHDSSPLPKGLLLKVEQNHTVDGEIISKNHITYSRSHILICSFRRPPRRRDFTSVCRNF